MKRFSIVILALSLCVWGAFFYYTKTSNEDLMTIEGKFADARQDQVIEDINNVNSMSTLISLKKSPESRI